MLQGGELRRSRLLVGAAGVGAVRPRVLRKAWCGGRTMAYEGAPSVLAEAMAVGGPVVSTECDVGPGEMLADGRGWLAPKGDAHGVAKAVTEALSNPVEAAKRAARAKMWINETLDLATIGESWRRLIQECTHRPMNGSRSSQSGDS